MLLVLLYILNKLTNFFYDLTNQNICIILKITRNQLTEIVCFFLKYQNSLIVNVEFRILLNKY